MITQELIDYMKTQLSSGVAREKITSDLLGQGGWTVDQINEAFHAAQQSAPTQISQTETVFKMTQAPKNIKYFEWLMYASFAGSVVIWLFQFINNVFQLHLIAAAATPLIGLLIRLLFVHQVVYKRANWARIALVVLFVLGFFGTLASIFFIFTNPILLVTTIPSLLEIAAIYFVFTKDSSAWLSKTETITVRDDAGNVVNVSQVPATSKGNIWNKAIPRTNLITALVSSGLFLFSVFGVGGGLGVFSSSDLGFFAQIMLATMVGFGFFALLENFVFCKSLKDSTSSGLDPWIMMLISARNFAVILSVIPLIQLLGMVGIAFGGIPWLIIYIILLSLRFKKSHPKATTTV